MIFKLISTAILAAGISLHAAENYKTETIQNKYIKLDVLPDACGRISTVRYLPENLELIEPYKESIVSTDPLLPEVIEGNAFGIKDWLWGKKPISHMKIDEIKVSKNKDNGLSSIYIKSKYYMSENLSLFKTIELLPGNSFFTCRIKVKNIDKQDMPVSLWENVVPSIGKKINDSLIIPAAGKRKESGGKTVELLPEDRLILETPKSELKENCFAPARGWVARFSKERDLIFATRTDLANLQNGFFYRWKNDDGSVFTQEIIFSERKLKPEEETEFTIDYLVFPGLAGLKEICGNIGIDCNAKDSNIELILASAETKSPGSLSLYLKGEKGITELGVFVIPELKPGKLFNISAKIPCTLKQGTYTICGKFMNGKEFELIEPKVDIR